jgi:hypothetical protein
MLLPQQAGGLLRRHRHGDVDIVHRPASQQVPHRAADHPRPGQSRQHGGGRAVMKPIGWRNGGVGKVVMHGGGKAARMRAPRNPRASKSGIRR